MKKSKAIKVGIFCLCGILLFGAGLFLIGNHNQLFNHRYAIYTEFASVDTLQSGAKVRVSGMDAGQVSDIRLPKQPSAKFRLKLDVDQKFRNIIREDSNASIETEGMVGNKFVNITKGTNNSPECPAGCTLHGQEPFEITDLLRQGQGLLKSVEGTITDVQHRTDTAIDNFSKVGAHVDGIVVSMRGNIERIGSNGAQITNGVNQIVSAVQHGRGTVGELLSDPAMAKKVETTIAQAEDTSTNIDQASKNAKDLVDKFNHEKIPEDVHQTVANLNDTSQEIKGAVTDFLSGPSNQNTAAALRQTIADAQRATRNLASDTEAVKHNFFLRGFFHRRGFYNLTQFNRREYASSTFVKHPSQRIWLPADALFAASSDGAQELTKQGQSAIDNAVSQVADHLHNNPLMVEGYAEGGSPAERYLRALQRAAEVKRYLESKFQLKPDLVGTIPLENKPPAGAKRRLWSGVCLALVVSRD